MPYQRSLPSVHATPTDDLTDHLIEGGRREVLDETDRDHTIDLVAGWIERVA